MSHHARIEELSDTDSDPPEQDPSDLIPQLTQRQPPPSSSQNPTLFNPQNLPEQLNPQFRAPSAADTERHKSYACIYPVYFDASRTKAEGRRVGMKKAVQNPLAREIVDACQGLGLDTVFEPGKMHPKDWANPGRVRVGLKDRRGGAARIKNKHHLYNLISSHLLAHPTTADSPLRLRIQGMPPPKEPIPPPAVPRGWKIGSILPLHSPALSGGG
ncbi:MAG: hypothetical protein Q9191_008187, partial [Dirinaria sp. TL-2023a]